MLLFWDSVLLFYFAICFIYPFAKTTHAKYSDRIIFKCGGARLCFGPQKWLSCSLPYALTHEFQSQLWKLKPSVLLAGIKLNQHWWIDYFLPTVKCKDLLSDDIFCTTEKQISCNWFQTYDMPEEQKNSK